MQCVLIIWLSISSFSSCFCVHSFINLVEGILGFKLKKLELVNFKVILCPYIWFALQTLKQTEQTYLKASREEARNP